MVSLDFTVIDASFSLLYDASSSLNISQLPLADLPNPSSIAATTFPSTGEIRLYYLDGNSVSNSTAAINEFIWYPPDSPHYFEGWEPPTALLNVNAEAHDTGAALAVTSFDAGADNSSAQSEMHIFFVDTNLQVAGIKWVNSSSGGEWGTRALHSIPYCSV